MRSLLPERYILNVIEGIQKKYAPTNKYNAWERNVIDEYKDLTDEEIKSKIEESRLPFAVLMTHIAIDYNLGAIVRIGNCLGAKVYYYGEKRYDRRGAVGCYKYSPITYLSSIEEVKKLKEEYAFVALEQTPQSVDLPVFSWPKNKKSLIVVGEESRGLQASPEIFELSDFFVKIKQCGSIRSLNASTAFAIAAYDFSCKFLELL